MNIKIERGTVKSGTHLCLECSHYRERRHEDGHTERLCAINDERSQWSVIRNSPVAECSAFHGSGNSSVGAMMSLAWQFQRNEVGEITFVDTNTIQPRMYRRPTFWQRVKAIFKREERF